MFRPFVIAALAVASILLAPFAAFAQAPADPPAVPAAPAAISADYADVISQTVGLIKQDKNADAFTLAQKAVALSPGRPEGYYYSGVALYRQNQTDGAVKMLNLAMERVASTPDSQITEATIKETLSHILGKQDYAKHVAAGDQALVDGLKAKAADEYTQAWRLDASHPEIGLKAAGLWKDLKDMAGCAKIVTVLKSSEDADTKSKALAMYDDIKRGLPIVCDELVTRGILEHLKGDDKAAAQSMTDATQVFSYPLAFQCLGYLYASQGNYDEAVKEFQQAAKVGGNAGFFKALHINLFKPHLRDDLLTNKKVQDFIVGAYGQAALNDTTNPKSWDDFMNLDYFASDFYKDKSLIQTLMLGYYADKSEDVRNLMTILQGGMGQNDNTSVGEYRHTLSIYGAAGNLAMLKAMITAAPQWIGVAIADAYKNHKTQVAQSLLPFFTTVDVIWFPSGYAIHVDDGPFLDDIFNRVQNKEELKTYINGGKGDRFFASGDLDRIDGTSVPDHALQFSSLLSLAVYENAPKSVAVLLKYGADTNSIVVHDGEDEGKTPLKYAEDHKYKEIVSLLKAVKAPEKL